MRQHFFFLRNEIIFVSLYDLKKDDLILYRFKIRCTLLIYNISIVI